MSYHSQMTFLYFSDLDQGKYFLEEVLGLEKVFDPQWAVVYKVAHGAYLGAVDASKGSVASQVRGGFLVSLTVDEVDPYYYRLKTCPEVKDLSEIKVFEDIGIRSIFFKGPDGYDFEIQQFINPKMDFTK